MNLIQLLASSLLAVVLILAATACSRSNGDGPLLADDDDSQGDDDDSTADDDDSAGDDDDSAGDDDDSAEPPANLISLALSADLTQITTRQIVTLWVQGSYDDGSSADLTDSANYFSTDETVLKVYTPGVAQPLAAGSATITASLGSLVAKASVQVNVVMAVVGVGDLVINELMLNPNELDVNDDTVADAIQDEFVEIANAADVALDISGVRIYDAHNVTPRHTFAAGTTLGVGHTIVVFGGGDVSGLSEAFASFETVVNDDAALPLGLALNNDQDTVRLLAPDDTTEISSVSYDPTTATALLGASLTLWDPEIYGTDYTSHQFAPGHNGNYSPGLLLTGDDYPGPDGVFGQTP